MPQDILATIAAVKLAEVQAMKRIITAEQLSAIAQTNGHKPLSLRQSILSTPGGIIAEHKRRSPSKGDIHPCSNVAEITAGYSTAGAAGISVLTDTAFFGGSVTDFAVARATVSATPLLRKEFIVDPWQIHQSAAMGADAILLIASLLSPAQTREYTDMAHSLGLEVLLELHPGDDLPLYPLADADLVGINNRNLRTFHTSLEASTEIASALPAHAVKIAESGISTPRECKQLQEKGFNGFLIGETFMKTANPPLALEDFLHELLYD